jgi:4-amino-4-deoxy-L-arabinose transferase-like glycosyltransferase
MNRSNAPSRWLAVWIGIAFLLRLLWVLHLPATDAQIAALPDQREYLDLGRNLLHGRGLVFHDTRFDADVYAYRTPGYPIFIALCGESVTVVRIAQAVLDTSSVLAVYFLASRWLDRRRSIFAAVLVALNPLLIYFSGLLLAETLFTTLLIWGMVLATSPRAKGGGLVSLGLSVLVRPSALVLPVFIAALNPLKFGAYHWRRAIVAGVVILLFLFPWAWRNHTLLGTWVWTTTNGGITLYDGFNPAADGSSDQSFVTRMPELKKMEEVQRSRYLADMARQFIQQNPGRVASLTVAKLLRTWSPIPLSHEYGRDPKYVLIGLLYTLPLFVMTLSGLLSDRLPTAAKVLLLLPAIYITIVHAASIGSIRYRVPADVPMAVVAAATGWRGKKMVIDE